MKKNKQNNIFQSWCSLKPFFLKPLKNIPSSIISCQCIHEHVKVLLRKSVQSKGVNTQACFPNTTKSVINYAFIVLRIIPKRMIGWKASILGFLPPHRPPNTYLDLKSRNCIYWNSVILKIRSLLLTSHYGWIYLLYCFKLTTSIEIILSMICFSKADENRNINSKFKDIKSKKPFRNTKTHLK